MKGLKKIYYLIGACVVALFGVACKSEDTLHVYEYSGWNDDTIYFDYSGETYQYENLKREAETKAPKFREVRFLGEVYELTYQDTIAKEFLPYAEDFYKVGDIEFSFIENTDTFSGVWCYGGTSIDVGKAEKNLIAEKDYKKIADDLVKEYIDIGKFTQNCSSVVTLFEEKEGIADCSHESYDGFYEKKNINEEVKYTFTYVGNFKGYETFEKVFVTLNDAGELCELQLNAVGLFDNKKESVAKIKEIEKSVKQKTKDICKDGYAIKDVNCDTVLCVNSEGKYFYLTFAESILEHLQDKIESEETSVFILAED